MPSVRRMILGHILSDLYNKISCWKKSDSAMFENAPARKPVSTFGIMLLGISHMVGAGIYMLTGIIVCDMAGPDVSYSFLIAGLVTLLTALCYVELASLVQKPGDPYIYTYFIFGEFWAFNVGWYLILVQAFGIASVARASSSFLNLFVDDAISNYTLNITGTYNMELYISRTLRIIPDFLAGALCIVYIVLMISEIKFSKMMNSLLIIINLAVMGLIIFLGIYYADMANWNAQNDTYFSYRLSRMVNGASLCFYVYLGFHMITTATEEAQTSKQNMPLAMITSIIIMIIAYVLLSGALILVTPYWKVNSVAAFSEAFASRGISWAKYVISVGAFCGMMTTLFRSLCLLPKTMYTVSNDNLSLAIFGRISKWIQMPLCKLISGLLSISFALLFDLRQLMEFMSTGILLAYTMIAIGVLVVRYVPDVHLSDEIGTDSNLFSPPIAETNSSNHSDLTSSNFKLDRNAAKFKPRYIWMGNWLQNCSNKMITIICLASFTTLIFFGDIAMTMFNIEIPFKRFSDYYLPFYLVILITCFFAAHKRNPRIGKFQVPLGPLIPVLSILFNVCLLLCFSVLSLLCFVIWILIGLIYLLYGIHKSQYFDHRNSVSNESSDIENGKRRRTKKDKKSSTLRINQKNDRATVLDDRKLIQ